MNPLEGRGIVMVDFVLLHLRRLRVVVDDGIYGDDSPIVILFSLGYFASSPIAIPFRLGYLAFILSHNSSPSWGGRSSV